ncbi:MAG TPA: OmpA family protein [Bryobacteraceae bacterium]|nr:OmpA family protein [Bryobacteraceae bacterium]
MALSVPILAQDDQLAEGWDFVPGEKILIYDDFTDMPRGGAPPHWKVRGGSVKLTNSGRLITPQDVQLQPNVAKWPENFTIETDLLPVKTEDSIERRMEWQFLDAANDWVWFVRFTYWDDENGCSVLVSTTDESGVADAKCKWSHTEPNKFAVWVQDGRLRLYLNKERLVDVNQFKPAAWTKAVLTLESSEQPVSFGPFRIAESAPDVSKTLFASGRYVTHGIQFDVNSDRLRPESAPILKQIAAALQTQPASKVRIDGHTDSTGDPAKNLDLSKRRAAAVKDALVKQHSIDAARLTTDGFGASKPLTSNDTPQGKAENRRVEFVKL